MGGRSARDPTLAQCCVNRAEGAVHLRVIVAAFTLGLNFLPSRWPTTTPPFPNRICLVPSPHLPCVSPRLLDGICDKVVQNAHLPAHSLHIPTDSSATCINNSGCCETVPGKDSSRACCQNEVSEHCSVFSPPLVPPCPPARCVLCPPVQLSEGNEAATEVFCSRDFLCADCQAFESICSSPLSGS